MPSRRRRSRGRDGRDHLSPPRIGKASSAADHDRASETLLTHHRHAQASCVLLLHQAVFACAQFRETTKTLDAGLYTAWKFAFSFMGTAANIVGVTTARIERFVGAFKVTVMFVCAPHPAGLRSLPIKQFALKKRSHDRAIKNRRVKRRSQQTQSNFRTSEARCASRHCRPPIALRGNFH